MSKTNILNIFTLNDQEQQESVERIHQLMEKGITSKEAIALVAKEIRKKYMSKV
ncbi:MAG: YoaH family protein [Arsenophonus sp. ET-YP4-MAG3]